MTKFKTILTVIILFIVVFSVTFIGFYYSRKSAFADTIFIPKTTKPINNLVTSNLKVSSDYYINYDRIEEKKNIQIEYISISTYSKKSDTVISAPIDGVYQPVATCVAGQVCSYENDTDIYNSYLITTDKKTEINYMYGWTEEN